MEYVIISCIYKGHGLLDITEYSRLNLVSTGSGSYRIIVAHPQRTISDVRSLAISSLEKFNDLLACKDNGDLIKNQIKNLGLRVFSNYKDFLEIIYKNNANIHFYDRIKPVNFKPIGISSDLAKSIYEVIVEEESKADLVVVHRGILSGLNLRLNTFEFQITHPKEIINGTFDQAIGFDVKEHLDKDTYARFKLHQHYSKITDEVKNEWDLLGFEEVGPRSPYVPKPNSKG